jgi:hypothetical protein
MTLSRATSFLRPTSLGFPPLPLKHPLSTHSFADTARKRATTFSPVIKRERKSEGKGETQMPTTQEFVVFWPHQKEAALSLCYL